MIFNLLARTCRQIHCPLNQFSKLFIKELKFKKVWPPNKQLACSISIFKGKEPPLDDQKDGELIYKGDLTGNIFRVKIFSFLSSGFGLAYIPMAVRKLMNEDVSTVAVVLTGSIIMFFTFGTPILFHFISRRYVRSLSYSKETDSYAAKTYSFFLMDKIYTFKTNEVDIPEIPPFLTSFVVRGNPLFVEPKLFTDASHYKRIMKYDEPLDFKLMVEMKQKLKAK